MFMTIVIPVTNVSLIFHGLAFLKVTKRANKWVSDILVINVVFLLRAGAISILTRKRYILKYDTRVTNATILLMTVQGLKSINTLYIMALNTCVIDVIM